MRMSSILTINAQDSSLIQEFFEDIRRLQILEGLQILDLEGGGESTICKWTSVLINPFKFNFGL